MLPKHSAIPDWIEPSIIGPLCLSFALPSLYLRFPRRHFENAILWQGITCFIDFTIVEFFIVVSLQFMIHNEKRLLPNKKKGRRNKEKEFQLLHRVIGCEDSIT